MKSSVHNIESKDGSKKNQEALKDMGCTLQVLILTNIYLNINSANVVDPETKGCYLLCDEKSKVQRSAFHIENTLFGWVLRKGAKSPVIYLSVYSMNWHFL